MINLVADIFLKSSGSVLAINRAHAACFQTLKLDFEVAAIPLIRDLGFKTVVTWCSASMVLTN